MSDLKPSLRLDEQARSTALKSGEANPGVIITADLVPPKI